MAGGRDCHVQGVDNAVGRLKPFQFRPGCFGSVGGYPAHLAPEVHTAASRRHAVSLTESSLPFFIDYEKQPVFDTALCIYAMVTTNKEALPGYPTAHTNTSMVWSTRFCGVPFPLHRVCSICVYAGLAHVQVVSYNDSSFEMVSDEVLSDLGYPAGTASYLKSMMSCDPTERPTIAQAVEWWSSVSSSLVT